MYSLRMSFCTVPRSSSPGTPCSSATSSYRGAGARAGALIVIEVETSSSGIPSSRTLHVLDRVDRDAGPADLAGRDRVVRVVAELRRQVERDREAGLAARRAGSGSARSSPPPSRSPRTGGSSTAGRGTCPGTGPRVNGNSPGGSARAGVVRAVDGFISSPSRSHVRALPRVDPTSTPAAPRRSAGGRRVSATQQACARGDPSAGPALRTPRRRQSTPPARSIASSAIRAAGLDVRADGRGAAGGPVAAPRAPRRSRGARSRGTRRPRGGRRGSPASSG